MSDKLIKRVYEIAGTEIDDDWLEVYVDELEKLPGHDAFSWGWAILMASKSLKPAIFKRAQESNESKELGCAFCGEKIAKAYDIRIGHICFDCKEEFFKDDE